ncbi:MAG: DinB family protein [Ferruginibacter sp.]
MSTISPTNTPGYFKVYIEQVVEKDLAAAFTNQSIVIKDLLPSISEEKSTHAYAPGKWTLKEMLQHLIDAERIFTYRAMCFARKESQTLPGFDENDYADNSFANNRSWESLLEEFVTVRRSTLLLFNSFSPGMLASIGKANSNELSVEQIGFIIAGHFTHHSKIIKERYL